MTFEGSKKEQHALILYPLHNNSKEISKKELLPESIGPSFLLLENYRVLSLSFKKEICQKHDGLMCRYFHFSLGSRFRIVSTQLSVGPELVLSLTRKEL
jgi:hypothetical protein